MTDTNTNAGESSKGNLDSQSQQSRSASNSEATVSEPPKVVSKNPSPGPNLKRGNCGGSNESSSGSADGPAKSGTHIPPSQKSPNAVSTTKSCGSAGVSGSTANACHASTQKQEIGHGALTKTKLAESEFQQTDGEETSFGATVPDPTKSSLPPPTESSDSPLDHGTTNSSPDNQPKDLNLIIQSILTGDKGSNQQKATTPTESSMGMSIQGNLHITRIPVPTLANQFMSITQQLYANPNNGSTFSAYKPNPAIPGHYNAPRQIPTPATQFQFNRIGQHSAHNISAPHHPNYTVSTHGPTYPPIYTHITEQLWNLLRTQERKFKAIFFYWYNHPLNPQQPPPPIPFSPNRGHWNSKNPSLVPMPFSSGDRWEKIVRELKSLKRICETEQPRHIGGRVASAVKSYCRDASHFDFEILSGREISKHVVSTIPIVVDLALMLPSLLACPIPILECGQSKTLFVSKMLCCSLLANAFFSTFPLQRSNMPDINFHRLFSTSASPAKSIVKAEKIMCLLSYFRQMGEPRYQQQYGNLLISYERRQQSQVPDWGSSKKGLIKIVVEPRKKIEEMDGMLQVDFANKIVGGGVLNDGAIMEEILFVVSPELILSRLFTDTLNDKEVLLITGAHQFSKYEGYSASFAFKEPLGAPKFGRDGLGRLPISIVAMDALHFKGNPKTQFRQNLIDRELQKALAGFGQDGSGLNCPVATGNWGCGAFNGDTELKFLIQWLAATEVGRAGMHFHTVGGKRQGSGIEEVVHLLMSHKVDAGKLYKLVVGFYDHRADYDSVFQFIGDKLKNRFRM